MRRSWVTSVAASCALITNALADPAHPVPDVQANVAELFDQGRALLAEGKPADACAKFDQAIRLDNQAAGVMLNLGLCNEKLGKYKTALEWFRKAQARATAANMPEQERAARDHIIADVKQVATIKIAFASAPPPTTKVEIDGDDLRPEDYERSEIDPGHHVLEASAPGQPVVHEDFDIADKDQKTLTLRFAAAVHAVTVDRGRGRRRAGMIVGVVGIGLLALDGGVAIAARRRYTSAKGCALTCTGQAQQDAQDKVQSARALATVLGNGLFFAGVAAVAVGGYLYFSAPRPERVDRVSWAPAIGPHQLGLAVSGTF